MDSRIGCSGFSDLLTNPVYEKEVQDAICFHNQEHLKDVFGIGGTHRLMGQLLCTVKQDDQLPKSVTPRSAW